MRRGTTIAVAILLLIIMFASVIQLAIIAD